MTGAAEILGRLALGTSSAEPPVRVVVAHPGDEIIGLGARFRSQAAEALRWLEGAV